MTNTSPPDSLTFPFGTLQFLSFPETVLKFVDFPDTYLVIGADRKSGHMVHYQLNLHNGAIIRPLELTGEQMEVMLEKGVQDYVRDFYHTTELWGLINLVKLFRDKINSYRVSNAKGTVNLINGVRSSQRSLGTTAITLMLPRNTLFKMDGLHAHATKRTIHNPRNLYDGVLRFAKKPYEFKVVAPVSSWIINRSKGLASENDVVEFVNLLRMVMPPQAAEEQMRYYLYRNFPWMQHYQMLDKFEFNL